MTTVAANELIDITGPRFVAGWGAIASGNRTGPRTTSIPMIRVFIGTSSPSARLTDVLHSSDDIAAIGARVRWELIFGSESAVLADPDTIAIGNLWLAEPEALAVVDHPVPMVKATPTAVPDLLGRIRHALSFSTTDLASVLLVRRPTVYNWLQGEAVRHANLDRIRAIFDIAEEWWTKYSRPVPREAYTGSTAGPKLLELLRVETLNSEAIRAQLEVVASVGQADRDRVLNTESIADRARRLGIPPVPDEVRADTLHFLDHREQRSS